MFKFGHYELQSMTYVEDGCAITARNIEHPLVKEFLRARGQLGTILGDGFIKIEGTNCYGGERLPEFLLRRGVNLLLNPHALDVDVTHDAKTITPMLRQTKSNNRRPAEAEFSGLKKGFLLKQL